MTRPGASYIWALVIGSGIEAVLGSCVDVVQQQLDTYNRRDLEGFLAVFADDVVIFDFGEPQPVLLGKAALAERYGMLFDHSPALFSELISRIVVGNTVIDHERIIGRNGDPALIELAAIYRVEQQLITRIDFIRT